METIGIVITAIVMTVCADSSDSLKEEFTEMGFTVQTVNPTTFLVSADKTLFEEEFGIAVSTDHADDGALENNVTAIYVDSIDSQTNATSKQIEWSSQLPLKFRNRVEKIEFEQPIAFGPTDF